MRSIASERFVFVDECSTNVSLSPIYARAPSGERAYGKAPRNYWGENISLICAIGFSGVKPYMGVEGAVEGDEFEIYLRGTSLLARSREGAEDRGDGQNLLSSVHKKSKRVEQLIKEAGATLLFLPPCSPELNP